jgi:hypothetical protein
MLALTSLPSSSSTKRRPTPMAMTSISRCSGFGLGDASMLLDLPIEPERLARPERPRDPREMACKRCPGKLAIIIATHSLCKHLNVRNFYGVDVGQVAMHLAEGARSCATRRCTIGTAQTVQP